MALGALSLAVTQGVQGRPFAAKINGLTTGRVEVLVDGSPGFWVANGMLRSNGPPYPVSTAVLREYDPGVGAGYRDTRLDIVATTAQEASATALASLGAGRSLVSYSVEGTVQEDGSIVYSVYARDDLGATAVSEVGAAIANAPIPLNYDVILYGDSRTEDGIGANASLTAGYNPASKNLGMGGWIGPVSGQKLRLGRFPNFGISASNTTQGVAVPRLDAGGSATTGRFDRPTGSLNFAGNKGSDYVASHPAGIVILLYGTNDQTAIPVTTEANLAQLMTDFGDKVIILLNELPRGIADDGTVQNPATDIGRDTLQQELLKYD
jgi:hypothetical protein